MLPVSEQGNRTSNWMMVLRFTEFFFHYAAHFQNCSFIIFFNSSLLFFCLLEKTVLSENCFHRSSLLILEAIRGSDCVPGFVDSRPISWPSTAPVQRVPSKRHHEQQKKIFWKIFEIKGSRPHMNGRVGRSRSEPRVTAVGEYSTSASSLASLLKLRSANFVHLKISFLLMSLHRCRSIGLIKRGSGHVSRDCQKRSNLLFCRHRDQLVIQWVVQKPDNGLTSMRDYFSSARSHRAFEWRFPEASSWDTM